jgi:hypothetical protein
MSLRPKKTFLQHKNLDIIHRRDESWRRQTLENAWISSSRSANSAFVVAKRHWTRIFCTDQPGRIAAVFIVAPMIAHKGFIEYDDQFLKGFSVTLFVWDLWWLCNRPPRKMNGKE